jgi:hypothetical protein
MKTTPAGITVARFLVSRIEELGIKSNKTWQHNALINPQFLGAQPARAGEDY